MTEASLSFNCQHAGYGMTGRGAQKCNQGYYNPGNNYLPCSQCPFGMTTSGPGVGKTSDDCIVAAGYGLTTGDAVALCTTGG